MMTATKSFLVANSVLVKALSMWLVNMLCLCSHGLVYCMMEVRLVYTRVICLMKNNLKAYIRTINYSCKFITFRALPFQDAIRSRASRCKCEVKRILQVSFGCLKKMKPKIDLEDSFDEN